MSSKRHLPMPSQDPISGKELYVSELTCDESGVTIRGKFEIPRYSKLNDENARFLEVFLKSRGILSTVEKELGLSYPTVRARLDTMLDALGLNDTTNGVKKVAKAKIDKRRKEILDRLEKGEISTDEAKSRLRDVTAE